MRDDDIRSLIKRCEDGDFTDADDAVLRSWLRDIEDASGFVNLLDEGVDCRWLVLAVADAFQLEGAKWSDALLAKLAEALLFHDERPSAEEVASRLKERHPADANAIRLWALCAETAQAVMHRFEEGLRSAVDQERVLRDARDFALKNEPPGLERGIERLADQLGIQER